MADQDEFGGSDVFPNHLGVGVQLRVRAEGAVEQAGPEPGEVRPWSVVNGEGFGR
ncbi:hypothetical protein ACFXG9_14210 [Streptomyces mirabilis]|uniref:hypothetical protein n=1 Tax=Streptomyces mirabilis TaxID=68239 RepID=UPI00368D6D8D